MKSQKLEEDKAQTNPIVTTAAVPLIIMNLCKCGSKKSNRKYYQKNMKYLVEQFNKSLLSSVIHIIKSFITPINIKKQFG